MGKSRSRSSTQLPLFRSEAQALTLAAIFLAAEGSTHVSAIAERIGLPVSTVHREVERLEQAGLLKTRRVGRNRVVAPNPASPYIEDIRSLVLKAYGPPSVIREELERVPGVDEVHVFGSWAARAARLPGQAAHDVDVLVIGTPSVEEVYDAASRAERRLGLEVNPLVVTRDEWEKREEGFLKRVAESELLRVI